MIKMMLHFLLKIEKHKSFSAIKFNATKETPGRNLFVHIVESVVLNSFRNTQNAVESSIRMIQSNISLDRVFENDACSTGINAKT